MPGRKQADGTYMEIVFPADNATRRMIEEKVFAAYRAIVDEPVSKH